jgi:hypothetical protein
MPEPSEADELPPDVVDALRRGRKVDAIKLVRERQGLDLKDAKALVERFVGTNRAELGLAGPSEGAGAGWIVTLVVLVAILYALYTYAG